MVLSIDMSHHIPDDVLTNFLREARRMLRAGGSLIFMDAVWNPRRPVGRLIWRYDRGASPRSASALAAALADGFEPVERRRLTFWHEYLLWLGRPRNDQVASARGAMQAAPGATVA